MSTTTTTFTNGFILGGQGFPGSSQSVPLPYLTDVEPGTVVYNFIVKNSGPAPVYLGTGPGSSQQYRLNASEKVEFAIDATLSNGLELYLANPIDGAVAEVDYVLTYQAT